MMIQVKYKNNIKKGMSGADTGVKEATILLLRHIAFLKIVGLQLICHIGFYFIIILILMIY